MRRAYDVSATGTWDRSAETATVTLPCADRHRRRIFMRDDAGEGFLLDLAEATHLRDGDGLILEDGGVLRIVAAAEPVAEAVCADTLHLARVAWHLGNRHTAVQILPDSRLRFSQDHVLEAMVDGLGASVTRTTAPFQPEGGAYAEGGHSHGPAGAPGATAHAH
jgi:urease accessory protein